eukprot:5977304-Pyramimonas_sp.AAC.1
MPGLRGATSPRSWSDQVPDAADEGNAVRGPYHDRPVRGARVVQRGSGDAESGGRRDQSSIDGDDTAQ